MKGLKWYQRFKSIQSSMTFAFVLLIALIMTASSAISFAFVKSAATDSAVSYTYQLIEQMSQNIEYYVREMEIVSNSLTSDYDVRSYFSDTDQSTNVSQIEANKNRISLQMDTLLDSREDIISATLFGFEKESIVYKKKILNPYVNIEGSNWYKGALLNEGAPYVTSSYVQNIYEGNYPWVVSMSQEIRGLNREDLVGVLVIDMNYKAINDICNKVSLGDQGYVYILDNKGTIVWHPKQQLINTGLYSEVVEEVLEVRDGNFSTSVEGDQRIYTVKTSQATGWYIVGVAHEKELVQNINYMAWLFVAVAFLSVLIAFIISRVISADLSRPIKNLKKTMLKVQDGDFDVLARIDSKNEIGDLSHTFNALTTEIKRLLDENVKEQRLKRKSELKALQAQINPHFLYNTLDSIIWMSLADKKEEVVEMTASLAKLFRLSINKGHEMITVKDEVAHVSHYLTIQKFRYNYKLTYDIHCEKEVEDKMTLKLILQPLVENAIYHGLKNKEAGGHIDLRIYQEEANVVFQIIDNGVGMTPERLEHIYEVRSENGSGVGAKNVYERLQLLYGTRANINYISDLEVGTTVTIKIPIEAEGGVINEA